VIFDGRHFHFDSAIVEHQNVTGADVIDQVFVINANTFLGAIFFIHGGVEHKRLPTAEGDFVIGETGNAELGALEIRKQRHEPALACRGFAYESGSFDVIFGAAVREIEAGYIHSRCNDGG